MSQCAYRCVVPPDIVFIFDLAFSIAKSQCTYRCVVLPDVRALGAEHAARSGLNAPTGAWCSLTSVRWELNMQLAQVSMHLQVRGAP